MSHIFLSYANEDRDQARRVVGLLEAAQWPVWWDRRIPAGMNWNDVLDWALTEMQCMIVLWTRHSVTSDWVYEEAEEGRKRGVLLPVLLEPVQPPRGFRSIQAADLSAWDGSFEAPVVQQLLLDLRGLTGIVPEKKTLHVPVVEVVNTKQQLAVEKPAPEPAEANQAELEVRLLAGLRNKMLLAASSSELKPLLYELEAWLAEHPLSADARLLKDTLKTALWRAQEIERPPAPRAPAPAPKHSGLRTRWHWGLGGSALAALLVGVIAIGFLQMEHKTDNSSTAPPDTAVTTPPANTPAPSIDSPDKTIDDKPAAKLEIPSLSASPVKPVNQHLASKNARCSGLLERAALGEPLSEAERSTLQRECKS